MAAETAWTLEYLPISIDLKQQALFHVDFLARVENTPELKDPDVLLRALYRYEKLWLPLAAEHKSECLSAPLDIEWIWHCHLLAPRPYANDCIAIAGTVVNHTLRSKHDYDTALGKSQKYWTQKYGEDASVAFYVNYEKPFTHPVPDDFQSIITYDVLTAAARQKVFYYQVALPHYKDSGYLEASLLRYRKFLLLKTVHPKSFSVPCFSIDLMWHTHMVNPAIYKKDTVELLGSLFHHDDSVNDRSEGSVLNNCLAETMEHWFQLYDEPFAAPGAMYRGQPPGGVLYKLSKHEIIAVSTKSVEIKLDKLVLKIIQGRSTKDYKCAEINATGLSGNREVTRLFSLNKQKRMANKQEIGFDVTDVGFTFKTRLMNKIKLQIHMKNTTLFACVTKPNHEVISDAAYDFIAQVENTCKTPDINASNHTEQKMSDGSCMVIDWSATPPVCGTALFFLQSGIEEIGTIPSDVKSFLGPVNLERLHSGTDDSCQITTICMKNHVGRNDFTSKLIVSPSLKLTFLQIFYRDHMVAVAHHIGCEQLPPPTKVDRDIITLSHKLGERALLIKNHAGDWAILKGRWSADKCNHDKGEECEPAHDSGTLFLNMYKMATGQCEQCSVDVKQGCRNVRLDGINVDLRKGVVEVETDSTEVGERLALAFCISLLEKMVVPKNQNISKLEYP